VIVKGTAKLGYACRRFAWFGNRRMDKDHVGLSALWLEVVVRTPQMKGLLFQILSL
jgi:hypothetical protein